MKENNSNSYPKMIDEVIKNGVKETHDDVYHHKGRLEGVIKCGKIIIFII